MMSAGDQEPTNWREGRRLRAWELGQPGWPQCRIAEPLGGRAVADPRKKGAAEGRTPCFVDEAGFYPLPAVVRTYAPVGQTPVLHEEWTHDHLSAISAVTPAGQLFARVQERSLCGQDVVRFLSQLLGQVAGKLLIVWDGTSIHCGQPVKAFLARQPPG